MVRRLLRFIIVYAVIAIAVSAVFIGVQNVMARTYEPEASDVFKDGEKPSAIASLSGGCLAVLGRYTEGANAGMLFCKIYNRGGILIARHDFYLSDTMLEVTGLITAGSGLKIVCLCTPWDDTLPGFGAVFGINDQWKSDETVFFKPSALSQVEGGFDNFVSADDSGSRFAGISGRTVTLFGEAGNEIASVSPDFFSVITDVASSGSSFMLAGADTESSLGTHFRYGLCAMYGIEGSDSVLKWQKQFMNEENWCSAILEVETADNGFTLIGRMLNVGGNNWQSINRIETFRADNDPERFHIGNDSERENPTSLFILNISDDGSVSNSALYYTDSNEYIPALMQYDSGSEYNPFLLCVRSAEAEFASKYSVNIMRMSRELRLNDTYSFPVSGDTVFLCSQDITGAGFYACVYMSGSGTYRVIHFTSMDDAVNHMQTLLRLKPVRDFFFTLKKKAPVLIILAFVLMLTVSGAARVRRKRVK
ncbi:MAG: hypothetical protein J5950_01145 [Clostridia bacterium]|nr:hypothetical protein [Clostridia bacterium]